MAQGRARGQGCRGVQGPGVLPVACRDEMSFAKRLQNVCAGPGRCVWIVGAAHTGCAEPSWEAGGRYEILMVAYIHEMFQSKRMAEAIAIARGMEEELEEEEEEEEEERPETSTTPEPPAEVSEEHTLHHTPLHCTAMSVRL